MHGPLIAATQEIKEEHSRNKTEQFLKKLRDASVAGIGYYKLIWFNWVDNVNWPP